MSAQEGVLTNERKEFLKQQFLEDNFTRFLMMELEKLEFGYAEASMSVRPGMTTREGIANGCLIDTLTNSAGVYAAMTADKAGRDLLTHTNIYHPGKAEDGDRLVAKARVRHETNKVRYVDVEVFNLDKGNYSDRPRNPAIPQAAAKINFYTSVSVYKKPVVNSDDRLN